MIWLLLAVFGLGMIVGAEWESRLKQPKIDSLRARLNRVHHFYQTGQHLP